MLETHKKFAMPNKFINVANVLSTGHFIYWHFIDMLPTPRCFTCTLIFSTVNACITPTPPPLEFCAWKMQIFYPKNCNGSLNIPPPTIHYSNGNFVQTMASQLFRNMPHQIKLFHNSNSQLSTIFYDHGILLGHTAGNEVGTLCV